MSDASEKPFEATPQRLRKARREGDSPRSAELAANVAFAAAGCAVAAIGPSIAGFARDGIARAASGGDPLLDGIGIVAAALVPVACAAAGGSAVGLLQSGGVHVVFPAPKFERLNPAEGVKRMGSRDTFAHGARAAAAFAIATAAMIPAIGAAAAAMTVHAPVTSTFPLAARAAAEVAGIACVVGTAFAVAEYAAARRTWLRKLRMSVDERKREMKEEEGDPLERGRRRALHRSFLRGAIADVKRASFVVVNPTHVAVALQYEPPAFGVPKILVRAAGDVAVRVRALAQKYDIPIVEDVALARTLFREGSIGNPIERAHFAAVAEVVAALTRAGLLRS
ncbi:MAG: EscU/YscU/HrcU family type III secretion system export apparatus switch protein [Candidatus Eremiobacteraeota bacterium]|nr:EscU/YscU/HrcU family type III secretion system export apparatus switch protein [Candidatus Eremiobacteraeota bacterium]